MRSSALVFAVACLATPSLVSPAAALNARTWISGAGVDQAGCGPISNPCRTLQFAHDVTSPGGEVNFKDSAGFGSVTISKAISIVADGAMGGVLSPAGGAAITVNAGSADTVVLRGLTIEGANTGYNGIVFKAGAILDIANCVIQNFLKAPSGSDPTGNGVLMEPSSGSLAVSITNTAISHNGNNGVLYAPPTGSTAAATIIIDRLTAIDNDIGAFLDALNTSGPTRVTFSNSALSKNALGLQLRGSLMKVDVDLCHLDGNSAHGLFNLTATTTVGRTVVANNGVYGIYVFSGTVASYKDNRIEGNASGPVNGTLGAATPL